MTRPIYETDTDRVEQWLAVVPLSVLTGTVAVEMPPLAPWDFEMTRNGSAVALVEVRCRSNARAKYETFMCAARKLVKLQAAANARRIASIMLVRWSDAVGFVKLNAIDLATFGRAVGGRVDRNDPLDIEPVSHIPIDMFTLMSRL